jgi:hypothetical protein
MQLHATQYCHNHVTHNRISKSITIANSSIRFLSPSLVTLIMSYPIGRFNFQIYHSVCSIYYFNSIYILFIDQIRFPPSLLLLTLTSNPQHDTPSCLKTVTHHDLTSINRLVKISSSYYLLHFTLSLSYILSISNINTQTTRSC